MSSPFGEALAEFLRGSGYAKPDAMRDVWVKGRFVLWLSYEPRDAAACEFGIAEGVTDARFPAEEWRGALLPYGKWLERIGVDAGSFVSALGGWQSGGLATPDFGYLARTIMETLDRAERAAVPKKTKRIAVLYLAIWAVLAAGLTYWGTRAGYSALAVAGALVVAFVVVNGSLSYLIVSRQHRALGQEPPRALPYILQTHKIGQPLRIPAVVRIAMGAVVGCGGLLFVLGGGLFVLRYSRTAELVVGVVFLALGASFVYVGYRVVRMNRPGRRLFGGPS